MNIDEMEAPQWLKGAAEYGHHDARADLSEEMPESQEHKRAKPALAWVRQAAPGGHARFCDAMGFIYFFGFDVERIPWNW